MLHKLKKMIEGVVAFKPHDAAADKLSPPGNVYNSSPAQLIQRGKVGSTNEFSNILFSVCMPHADSTSGPFRLDGIYTRTTPVADVDYDDLPIGSLCVMHTVASKAITDCQIYQYNIFGYGAIMTDNRNNTITATATTAGAATRWDALRLRSICGAGITCAADHTGLYIETEVTGTGIDSGSHYGIKLETYITSAATITGDHYGIAVFTYSDIAGNQEIYPLRLEHNGASVAGAFINLQNAAGKMRLLVSSSTTNDTWMSVTTTVTCSTAGGWYKVKHGGYTRYIQLYTTVS